ncbi:MAG: serine/threonine-protein kinase [Planctomycetia bacterium]|nr:serine/threonine-protein kinase [Planctomycetia bacterium]
MLSKFNLNTTTSPFPQSVYSDLYKYTFDFEKHWYTNSLSIEEILLQVDPNNKMELFERLLEIDLSLKLQNSLPISEDEYDIRFPQYKSTIHQKIVSLQEQNSQRNSIAVNNLLGTRIGNYQFVNVIGQGGMGVVYEGFDISPLKRRVAIKSILKDPKTQEERLKLFEKELTILGNLPSGSAFVQGYGSEKTDDGLFLIMEYIDGMTLRKYVDNYHSFSKKRLSYKEILRIIREIALGLKTIHQLGIVHRDIKPENIMLEQKSGRVRILDLGLSASTNKFFPESIKYPETEIFQKTGFEYLKTEIRYVDKDDSSQKVIGTPAYMAPETYFQGKFDTRSDLYSLGGTFFFLLTGKQPNQWFDLTRTELKIAPSLKKFLYNNKIYVPSDILSILIQLLQQDNKKRYQKVEDVIFDLDQAIVRRSSFIPLHTRTKIVITTTILLIFALTGLFSYFGIPYLESLKVYKVQNLYEEGKFDEATQLMEKINLRNDVLN